MPAGRGKEDERCREVVTYSFLLVNYNMKGLLPLILEQLRSEVGGAEPYEVLIADNSTDADFRLPASFEREWPEARVLRQEQNRGFVDALNHIAPEAGGRYVVVLHPDIEFRRGCLSQLRQFVDATPQAGVVSPDIRFASGLPNACRLKFPSVGYEIERLLNILTEPVLRRRLLAEEPRWDRTTDAEADMVMSVCMFFRAEAFRAVTPIDSRLHSYHANDLLCLRLRQRSWKCYYVRAASVTHHAASTPEQLYSARSEMAFKASSSAGGPLMNRDRLIFLRELHGPFTALVCHAVGLAEHAVELAKALRRRRNRRNLGNSGETHSP
jgi:GT2 family glycosyltransferase